MAEGGVNVGPAYASVTLDPAGFLNGLRLIRDQSRDTFDQVNRTFAEKISTIGSNMQTTGLQLTRAFAPITGFVTGGIFAFSRFDDTLVQIQARTGATADQMDVVRLTALQMGQDTQFSASQAADAFLQLLSSGSTLEESLQALPDVLDLAAAGGLDLGYSADALTDIMAQFQLTAGDTTGVVDALARASGSSSATVADLIDGFANVGPVARGMGLSVDDTAAALAVFAENGIKGSEAGTQLRSMLNNMTRDTADVQGVWNELGVSMFDSEGNFRDLNDVIQDLNVAMADMTEEERQATIRTLGGAYGQMGLSALLAADGTEAMKDRMELAADASVIATARMMSFRGVVNQLRSSLETLSINILGPLVNDYIKPLVLWLVLALNKFNEWLTLNPQVAEAIGLILTQLAFIGPLLFSSGAAIMAFGAILSLLTSPLFLLMLAVDALFLAWKYNWFGIREITAEVIDAIGPLVDTAISLIRDTVESIDFLATFERVRDGVTDVFTTVGPIIQSAFVDTFISARDTLTTVFATVGPIITEAMSRLVEIFNQIPIQEIVERLGGMSTILRILAGVIISILFPPLGILLRIFSAVQIAMQIWDQGLEKTGKNVSKFFEDMGKTVSSIFKVVSKQLTELARELVEWIGPQIPILIESLIELSIAIVSWIGAQIPRLIIALAGWASAFLDWLGPVLAELLPQLGTLIGGAIEWILSEGVPMLVVATAALAAVLIQWLYDIAPDILPALFDLFESLVDFVMLVGPALLEAVFSVILGFANGMIGMFSSLGSLLMDNVVQPIINALSNLTWDDVGNFLSNLWDAIKGGTIDAVEWVGEHIVTPIIDSLRTIDWSARLGDLLDLVWNSLIAGIVFVINAAAWIDQYIALPLMNDLRNMNWGQLLGDLLSLIWNSLLTAIVFVINAAAWMDQHIILPLMNDLRSTNWGALLGDLLSLVWNSIIAVIAFSIDAVGWVSTNIVDPLVTAVRGALPTLRQAGVDLLSEIGEGIKSVSSVVAKAFTDAINALIPDRISIRIPAIHDPIFGQEIYGGGEVGVNLPNPFARGGLFKKGEFMLTGEEGTEMGIANTSGMIVGNDQLRSAMNVLAGGVQNVAALLQPQSQLSGALAGGGQGNGDTYHLTVQLPESAIHMSDSERQNLGNEFGEAILDRLRTK